MNKSLSVEDNHFLEGSKLSKVQQKTEAHYNNTVIHSIDLASNRTYERTV